MLSFEDRLLQLERLERWCSKATTWQQYRVALPIGLFLGSVAGLVAGLPPYPTPDEVCEIMTYPMRIQVGASFLPADFAACPQTESDQTTRSHVVHRALPAVELISDHNQISRKQIFTKPSLISGDRLYRFVDPKEQGTVYRTDAASTD
jgi:hypothetical protein